MTQTYCHTCQRIHTDSGGQQYEYLLRIYGTPERIAALTVTDLIQPIAGQLGIDDDVLQHVALVAANIRRTAQVLRATTGVRLPDYG